MENKIETETRAALLTALERIIASAPINGLPLALDMDIASASVLVTRVRKWEAEHLEEAKAACLPEVDACANPDHGKTPCEPDTGEGHAYRAPVETPAAPDFKAALDQFVAKVQAMQDAHTAKNFPNIGGADKFTIDPGGKKFVRIVRARPDGGQRSVYCFVKVDNGDILKAASWKAPAPHARGNIYGADPLKGCGPYGVAYLR